MIGCLSFPWSAKVFEPRSPPSGLDDNLAVHLSDIDPNNLPLSTTTSLGFQYEILSILSNALP